MERYFYRHASAIATLSDGHKDYILRRGANPQSIFTVPPWANLETIRPDERMNEFRTVHGLGDNFVVLFAGTMGVPQGLEVVVDAARQLADEPGLLFLMVGDGVERDRLENRANGLRNVRFLPMQPKSVYPQVLAACDVGLVTLRPDVATPTVPSKLMTIMAAGRPVLASVPDSAGPDVAKYIFEAQGGCSVPAGDSRALAETVLKLKRDPQTAQRMGLQGRAYAEKHFTRDACVLKIDEILKMAVNTRA